MNYNEFKEEIKRDILNFLPGEYADAQCTLEMMPKTNGLKEALVITPAKEEGVLVVPNLYLEQFYELFLRCNDIEKTKRNMAEFYLQACEYAAQMEIGIDIDNLKENRESIALCLVGRRQNEELLEKAVNRNFLDLAVVYRWIFSLQDGTFNTSIVTQSQLKELNMDEPELFALARENTLRMFPPRLETIAENFMVLTNDRGFQGAGAVLYSGLIREAATKMKGDLYVIPSSIHEFILIPASAHDASHVKGIIEEANRTVVEKEEILSSSLYYYSLEEDRITVLLSYS